MNTQKNKNHQPSYGLEYMENGLFLRGLIQVMLSDGKLHREQREKIKEYARELGFEKSFVEEAIDHALTNKHIPKDLPKFFSRESAERFIKAAIEIAFSNLKVHPMELTWLINTAKINDVDVSSIKRQVEELTG